MRIPSTKTNLLRGGIIVFAVILVQFASAVDTLFAQDPIYPSSDAKQDSLALNISFDIKMLKLNRMWSQLVALENFSEIVELKLFAEEAGKDNDYSLALIYLDEIFNIIAETNVAAIDSTDAGNIAKVQTSFEKELLTGIDFSQQQFHLTFDAQDSAYVETFNNPFTGIQLRWNRMKTNDYDLELGGQFKYSRDYTTWQFNSRLQKENLAGFTIQLDQRGEGMNYKQVFPIQYWQSLSGIDIEKEFSRYVSLELTEEFQYRNYDNESETFATYWRNEYQALLGFNNFWNSRFIISYDQDQRWQKTYSIYDYNDKRMNVQHYFNPSWRTSLSSWYQYRQMDYPFVQTDTSYIADFNQHYLSFTFKQNIQDNIALRFYGEGYIRDYPVTTQYLPDYKYLRLEPGLQFELSEKFTCGAGYLFETRRYNKSAERQEVWSLNENLVAEGIVLSLDYFDFKNLLLSFSHTIRLNTYPQAPEQAIPGIALFTDRLENSTMLFVSYKFLSALETSLILQHDIDRDREIPNNDSRSSIFTLDFTWGF